MNDIAPSTGDPQVDRSDQAEAVTAVIRGAVDRAQFDIDQLVAGSLRAGTQLKRRRRAAAATSGLLGVAAAVLAVQAWSGGWTTTTSPTDVQPAWSPSQSPTRDETCPSAPGERPTLHAPPVPNPPQAGERGCDRAIVSSGSLVPVRLGPDGLGAGWTCTAPADDKFECSRSGDTVAVTLRDADTRSAHTSDAGKRTSATTFSTEVYGDHFATVDRVAGTPDLAELAGLLVWEDS